MDTPPTIAVQRATAALKSLFIADALSMPVHWYYNPLDIQRAYPGGIKGFEAAAEFHPSSIMSLHSTSAGGRGSQKPRTKTREIVGDVILRGKRQYWDKPNQHYHRALPAGENTLNACCARLLMRSVTTNGSYSETHFLDEYIAFMTADPPQHPDTYAESYHRGFFANLESGKPANQCGAVTHDTPSVGGLVTIVPLALALLIEGNAPEEVQATCRKHLFLTHPDATLGGVCDALVELISSLLVRPTDQPVMPLLVNAARAIPRTNLQQLLDKSPGDAHIVGGKYSTACYITDSWPALMYLAGKYSDDPLAAMLANTNLGGENAHRGSVLGSIVSLASGTTPEPLFRQLVHTHAIEGEITALLT